MSLHSASTRLAAAPANSTRWLRSFGLCSRTSDRLRCRNQNNSTSHTNTNTNYNYRRQCRDNNRAETAFSLWPWLRARTGGSEMLPAVGASLTDIQSDTTLRCPESGNERLETLPAEFVCVCALSEPSLMRNLLTIGEQQLQFSSNGQAFEMSAKRCHWIVAVVHRVARVLC